jgi:hypothetical protein
MAFGDKPLGPFPHHFTFGEDLGCALNIVFFVLFLIAVFLFWQFVLN